MFLGAVPGRRFGLVSFSAVFQTQAKREHRVKMWRFVFNFHHRGLELKFSTLDSTPRSWDSYGRRAKSQRAAPWAEGKSFVFLRVASAALMPGCCPRSWRLVRRKWERKERKPFRQERKTREMTVRPVTGSFYCNLVSFLHTIDTTNYTCY